MIRILAIFNQQEISSKSRLKISEYFNKILCVAIPEIIYKGKIKNTSDFEKRLDYSIGCYDCKSLDMDIFVELPLIKLYDNDREIDDIVSLTRIHRAICLIKKDFRDLEHDIENETETPLIILFGEGKENLKRYMGRMFEHYEKESVKMRKMEFCGNFQEIAKRLQELILKEIGVSSPNSPYHFSPGNS